MKPYRPQRLASVLKRELSSLFLRTFDFGGALVTITDIRVAKNLERAEVDLSILPFEKGPEMFTMIEERRREIEHELRKRLKIRSVPRLHFSIAKPAP